MKLMRSISDAIIKIIILMIASNDQIKFEVNRST